MIHSSLKISSHTDAMNAMKGVINAVLVSHLHKEDLRPSEMATLLQTDVQSVSDIISYKLDGFTVERMLHFVMHLGYSAQTACNQDNQLTFTFSKGK